MQALLVAVQLSRGKSVWTVEDSLTELAELARTGGYEAARHIIQVRESPHPTFYVGEGKMEEIKTFLKETDIKLVIIDDEISPAQSKHIEQYLQVKVIDRTGLILDIFAKNARTSEAKLQVEMAQLEYLYPRLTRLWTHLSRLGGGIGTRGPGEKQLEVDKRQIQTRIETIKEKLEKIKSHRIVVRHQRDNVPTLSAAIIGYTNAGKSTLINAITKADVLTENKLFATLDPTSKRLDLPNKDLLIVTDTVGFIQKLPHQLVSSFRATLEEVTHTDFLLHVVDISHPKHEVFIQTAHEILHSLGADDMPQLYIFNKADLIADPQQIATTLERYQPNVLISALSGDNLSGLLEAIMALLAPHRPKMTFTIPYSEMSWVPILHEMADVHTEHYTEDGVCIEATLQTILGDKILHALGIQSLPNRP